MKNSLKIHGIREFDETWNTHSLLHLVAGKNTFLAIGAPIFEFQSNGTFGLLLR